MTIITYSKIGYNTPSQANWSYSIYKIDIITDTQSGYAMSFIAKAAHGGESRFVKSLRESSVQLIETKSVYTSTGVPKITGIAKIPDIESEELIKEIVALIK
jgi:hypothetical protein